MSSSGTDTVQEMHNNNHDVHDALFLSGAFQFRSELQSVRLYQSTGGLHIFVMASEVVYFLFIIYYMYIQVNNTLSLFCFYYK